MFYIILTPFIISSTSTRLGGFSSTEAPPTCSFVTYFWHPYGISIESALKQNPIDVPRYSKATLSENRTTIEKGTTGLRTWLASFVLAQYLISHPSMFLSEAFSHRWLRRKLFLKPSLCQRVFSNLVLELVFLESLLVLCNWRRAPVNLVLCG